MEPRSRGLWHSMQEGGLPYIKSTTSRKTIVLDICSSIFSSWVNRPGRRWIFRGPGCIQSSTLRERVGTLYRVYSRYYSHPYVPRKQEGGFVPYNDIYRLKCSVYCWTFARCAARISSMRSRKLVNGEKPKRIAGATAWTKTLGLSYFSSLFGGRVYSVNVNILPGPTAFISSQ